MATRISVQLTAQTSNHIFELAKTLCEACIKWRLTLFADFIADQGTGCSTAKRANWSTQDSTTYYATNNSTSGGTDLCICR